MQNSKRKGESGALLVVLFVGILFVAGLLKFNSGTESIQNPLESKEPTKAPQNAVSVGYATTLQAGGMNAITGASVTDARGWIYANDGSYTKQDIAMTSAVTNLGTDAPNALTGFLMYGNDANQGTDGGTEWYYRKIPFSYSGQGTYVIKDPKMPTTQSLIPLYAEATTFTWTGYDDGTVEATTNVTVGTSVISSTELKMEVGANTAFGNPDLPNPVGVCINATALGTWNDIKPVNYVEKFVTPEILKGRNIIGCYVLPTPAIIESTAVSSYKFALKLDPASNPDEFIYVYPMDKTYFLDDNLVWQEGFGDDSNKGTDRDPGLSYAGNEKQIHAY